MQKKEGCYIFICMSSNNTVLKREKRNKKIDKSETLRENKLKIEKIFQVRK